MSTEISVTKDALEVARVKMNWKGHITISLQDGQEFILKATGTFLSKYVLEDKHQQNNVIRS